jgi:putative two-component system response regulator
VRTDTFQHAHILVIDDEESTLRVVRKFLQHAGYHSIATLSDPTRVEEEIAARPPDLVLLDLRMPGRDGLGVLEVLHHKITHEHLPVLVVTGDATVDARRRALTLGARDFVTKPIDLTELTLRVRNQLEMRQLYSDVHKQLEEARLEMIERLAVAAEYRDDDTGRHTIRVGELSAALARKLGLREDYVRVLERAARLHDIGKIGIPDALLLKTSPLTEEEMTVMRTHTIIGGRILGGSMAPVLQLAEIIALTHHERWNGGGYPENICGDTIPLAGRIVAVADAYDALTNDRPYRRAKSPEEALIEIDKHRGSQFDPAVVDALLSVVALRLAPSDAVSLAQGKAALELQELAG